MPFFRRRPAEPLGEMFTVGVDNHRVLIGGSERGVVMLAELDAYVPVVAARARVASDGRDAVAVQSAKMDYAEMVDATIAVLRLALQELVERASLESSDVPDAVETAAIERSLPTYEYIQATYSRAQERIEWVRAVDRLLTAHGIAVLPAAQESRTRPL
jgi:hypothetical protein